MSAKAPQYGDRRPSSQAASRAMRGNRSRDTRPEIILRQALWHRGLRYRVHYDPLPGKPDIAFIGPKVAVFCDGDFWHGRNWKSRQKKLREGANPDYWLKKIAANRERDERRNQQLKQLGWKVVRIWEGEIRANPDAAASKVEQEVRSRL